MTNIQVAQNILQSLRAIGAHDLILCAGARNAPFVTLLSEASPFRVYTFFDERSAAFFAIGRMQSLGRPVAVITTSGTAAAELLPATIEAQHQGLPLVLVTADRPRRYRGVGAPQSINQIGLYSHYVEKTWDIEGDPPQALLWSRRRPVHVNVCFEQPLLDGEAAPWGESPPLVAATVPPETAVNADLNHYQTPLVVVGGLPLAERAAVVKILSEWQRPVYLEAPSGLRGHPELQPLEILGGEASLARLSYDAVIRIGSVPTLRLWRDLENSSVPVVHFSHLPWAGLPRAPRVWSLAHLRPQNFRAWSDNREDREIAHAQSAHLAQFPLSEPSWFSWLSQQIPRDARIFIGNSLPIREWDSVATRDARHEIFANRGVNGIDGLVSTFLGLAQEHKSNWCILGDLSALYDLNGLWAARVLTVKDLNIVVINNGGGKIFTRMFHNPLFENQHTLGFGAWATMWNWDYLRLEKPQDLAPAHRPRVIEIVPEDE